MVNKFLIQLLLIMGLYLSSLGNAESIKIVTDAWVNTTNRDGSGYFFDLLHKIYDPYNIELDVHFVPYGRSLVMLSNGEADVVLGVYAGEYPQLWYAKYPVGTDIVDVAISEAVANEWQGLESLKGKRVVMTFGYSTESFMSLSANYSEVRNVESMLKMLAAGRVDAVIGYKKDFIPLWQTLGQKKPLIIKEEMFRFPIFFAFHTSERVSKYKQIFETEIKKIIDSGELKKMLHQGIGNMEYYHGYDTLDTETHLGIGDLIGAGKSEAR